ncbi:hypothetical protein L1887_49515 [Cichorium endivia]|nr:hypothetical protein L1887_49515 [Cichorium endivia]
MRVSICMEAGPDGRLRVVERPRQPERSSRQRTFDIMVRGYPALSVDEKAAVYDDIFRVLGDFYTELERMGHNPSDQRLHCALERGMQRIWDMMRFNFNVSRSLSCSYGPLSADSTFLPTYSGTWRSAAPECIASHRIRRPPWPPTPPWRQPRPSFWSPTSIVACIYPALGILRYLRVIRARHRIRRWQAQVTASYLVVGAATSLALTHQSTVDRYIAQAHTARLALASCSYYCICDVDIAKNRPRLDACLNLNVDGVRWSPASLSACLH